MLPRPQRCLGRVGQAGGERESERERGERETRGYEPFDLEAAKVLGGQGLPPALRVQGYLSHKKHPPPLGPYSRHMSKAPWWS